MTPLERVEKITDLLKEYIDDDGSILWLGIKDKIATQIEEAETAYYEKHRQDAIDLGFYRCRDKAVGIVGCYFSGEENCFEERQLHLIADRLREMKADDHPSEEKK